MTPLQTPGSEGQVSGQTLRKRDVDDEACQAWKLLLQLSAGNMVPISSLPGTVKVSIHHHLAKVVLHWCCCSLNRRWTERFKVSNVTSFCLFLIYSKLSVTLIKNNYYLKILKDNYNQSAKNKIKKGFSLIECGSSRASHVILMKKAIDRIHIVNS